MDKKERGKLKPVLYSQRQKRDKKESDADKIAKFMVATSNGYDVIKSHHYNGSVNGEVCADFSL